MSEEINAVSGGHVEGRAQGTVHAGATTAAHRCTVSRFSVFLVEISFNAKQLSSNIASLVNQQTLFTSE